MNRQEAIKKLQKQKAEYLEEWVDYSGVAEAFDMAIDALNHQTVFEQIKWERDVALQTLEEHGIGLGQKSDWTPVSEPPKDGRNVFLAHGTNNFKSCCIGHYEQGMGWYEDRNFFAKPIYDCKYWCDIPELPDMGDNQFDMRGEK